MTPFSRRTFLGGIAGGTALSLLPNSLLKAMAAPAHPGGLNAIEHVIVLMQENRSFDNYFGTLAGVRGFGDRTPLRLPSGKPVFSQPRVGETDVLPFSARASAVAAGRAESDVQYLGSLPHGFGDATRAWAQGWWNDWAAAKTPSSMAHYDRQDIPLQFELADRFTVCDAYFCSIHGSTNPNRNYLWTGTTGYEPDGVNRAVTNAAYSYTHGGYDWTTYPERLEAAGISWQIYQEWDNFTDNAVEYFRPWKEIGSKILSKVGGGYHTTEEFYDRVSGMSPADRAVALAQFQTGVDSLTDAERRLFMRGAYRSEPDTLVPRLRADIEAGTLPAVSWLVPSAWLSEHPGSSTPVGSANFIYEVLDAIASDPATWARTVLLINFDENDGYFDHVPAPTAPRPVGDNDDDWFNGLPIGLGPRVPMTIVSPWTVGGFVCSEVFDHTSVLRFLERWTGVEEPNISAWRRSVCGDLTSAFDFKHRHRQPQVAQPGPIPAPISRWSPRPPAEQAMPAQESGTRAARPLPYRLALRAQVVEGALEVELTNGGTTAAPVIGYAADGSVPRQWPVPARGQINDTVEFADGYDLRVHGPGWSMWALRGRAPAAEAELVEQPGSRRLVVRCTNPSAQPRTLLVGESVYGRHWGDHVQVVRVGPGHERRVQIKVADHGWYDVAVVDRDDPLFMRRMTGRLADGRCGVTDPATGVAPAASLSIVLPDAAAGRAALVQGTPAEVVLVVTNTGDATLSGLVAGIAAPAGWTIEPDEVPPSLAAGASAEVRVVVTPAADAIGGDLIAAVHATSNGLLAIAEARTRADVVAVLSATLDGPASSPMTDGVVLPAGRPLTVTATATNAGSVALTDLIAQLAVPDGWTATPTGQASAVEPGASVSFAWDVVAPAAAARGSATLTGTITANLDGEPMAASASLTAKVGPNLGGYLLAEDFESVVEHLAPALDLNVPAGVLGWTQTPPEGWTITNAPDMPQGTREEQGWSFMSKQFWFASDGQERELFSRGLGIVAVADPDDWDDTGDPESRGRFDSTLTSPAVPIPAGTTQLHLGFDSHYRQEEPMEAEVTVEFDTGQSLQLLHWGPTTDETPEKGEYDHLVALPFDVPAGATSVRVAFRLYNAMNDWYWSIDHVRLGGSPIVD